MCFTHFVQDMNIRRVSDDTHFLGFTKKYVQRFAQYRQFTILNSKIIRTILTN